VLALPHNCETRLHDCVVLVPAFAWHGRARPRITIKGLGLSDRRARPVRDGGDLRCWRGQQEATIAGLSYISGQLLGLGPWLVTNRLTGRPDPAQATAILEMSTAAGPRAAASTGEQAQSWLCRARHCRPLFHVKC
jgi:hypothetical protein